MFKLGFHFCTYSDKRCKKQISPLSPTHKLMSLVSDRKDVKRVGMEMDTHSGGSKSSYAPGKTSSEQDRRTDFSGGFSPSVSPSQRAGASVARRGANMPIPQTMLWYPRNLAPPTNTTPRDRFGRA